MKIYLAIILVALFPSHLSAQEALSGSEQLEANKQVLLKFLSLGSDFQARREMLTDDYIQHNPRFLELAGSGGDAWLEAGRIAFVETGGQISLTDPDFDLSEEPVILMAEGDLVTAIFRSELTDPDDPTHTYEAFIFETVRIRDGKLAEHWDGIKLESGWKEALP